MAEKLTEFANIFSFFSLQMDENQRQMRIIKDLTNEINRLTTQEKRVEEVQLEGFKLLKNETGLLYNPEIQPRE